jgi:hypothetical protein
MHCGSPHMVLWTGYSQCHFFAFFFLNLAIIGFNYKLICWGKCEIERHGTKVQKTQMEWVALKSLGEVFIVIPILYKL